MSEKSKILKQSELTELRQNARCYFCGSTDDLVVDHDHRTHHIRHTLCRTCNGSFLLGGIENRLNALATRAGITLKEAIQMIQLYLTDDYTGNDYYSNMLAVKAKQFSRLNAGEQRETLKAMQVNTLVLNTLNNSKQRLAAYKAALKQQYKRK